MYLGLTILSVFCCCYAQGHQLDAHLAHDIQRAQDHHVWFQRVNKAHGATAYYGVCGDDSQCEWLGANSQCKYGRCQCQDKFRWYTGKCVAYSGLNERCTNDIDCYDGYTWNSMKCLENTCVCNDGFQKRDSIDCRKISKAKGPCALTMDCPNGYSCEVGICKKNSSKNELSYLKVQEKQDPNYGPANLETNGDGNQACNTDTDCQMDNSECYSVTKTCVCKKGYFLHNNTCEGELGLKKCVDDRDCYVLQATCTDVNGEKQCRCRDYWFYSKDNRKCIKTMLETNWNCLSNEWCYALGVDSYCSAKGTCKCSSIATLNQTNMVCKKERDSTLCKCNEECEYVKPHSICVDEACVCKDNYKDKNGVCKSVLGGACTSLADCQTIEHAICSNHKCICEPKFVQSETDNTICLEEAKIGEKCKEDIQCIKDNRRAICSEMNICECKSSFRYVNSTCEIVKSFQDYCTDTKQCHFENEHLICRNSKCQCPTNKKLVNNKCIPSLCMQMKPYGALILVLAIKVIFTSQ